MEASNLMTKLMFLTILVTCWLNWSLDKTVLTLEDFMVIRMYRMGGMSQHQDGVITLTISFNN